MCQKQQAGCAVPTQEKCFLPSPAEGCAPSPSSLGAAGELGPRLPLPKVTTGPLLTMASPWEGAVTSRNENHGLGHPVAIHRARSAEISGMSGA